MRKLNIPLVDLKAQFKYLKNEINIVIQSVINDSSFILGKYVEEFEQNFAKFCNSKYCVAVGNGTDALTIALKCCGIGKNDEVIVPANTFIATSEAVTLCGAKPIFVDVDPNFYLINLDDASRKITKRTKAIIVVHLYGQPANMQKIVNFAKAHNLKIIQDCAQSHGAKFNNQHLVEFGDVCCYSFFPGKNLGAFGDAGAIVTNDEELATKCKMFRNHGRLDKYDHLFEGTNSRMDGLQGAILNVKLKYLEEWNDKRRNNAYLYNKLFEEVSEVVTPTEQQESFHVYHLYVIRSSRRKELTNFLSECGITTGIHYPIALPFLKAYSYMGHKKEDFPVAFKLQNEILSLPMYPELKENQIKYIVGTIKKFYKKRSFYL
ncbi:MAG: DegT/DnrJ/EryC1/StrS family aminotransferase [Ignavibacteria bacterium]|nr:DegT/DnrJ/EryC1/StrS family aminotransferase [Ignavibacteria bacterium]